MDIEQLARSQLADYDAHSPGLIFQQGASFLNVRQAYAIQFRVAQLRIERGEQLAGYKIGCVSRVVQQQLGLRQPAFGHVFSSEIHRSGAELDPARFDHLAVEGELAVRIAEDIPHAQWLSNHRSQAIAAVFPVIELHNYVFRSLPPTPQELIANNALHAGLVVCNREDAADPYALLQEPITVIQNGRPLDTSSGAAFAEGPLASLSRLVEHLNLWGSGLLRGQIVLTGSPLPLYPVSPGDRIEVKCRKLAGVEISIQQGALGP